MARPMRHDQPQSIFRLRTTILPSLNGSSCSCMRIEEWGSTGQSLWGFHNPDDLGRLIHIQAQIGREVSVPVPPDILRHLSPRPSLRRVSFATDVHGMMALTSLAEPLRNASRALGRAVSHISWTPCKWSMDT